MSIISADWKMQNNYYDTASNFIYKVTSLDECLIEIERTGTNKEYALHRWYNYITTIHCEHIFCEYGAIPEKDKYNQYIYHGRVPFNVKLTVYPTKISYRLYDLTTRVGKNDMIC